MAIALFDDTRTPAGRSQAAEDSRLERALKRQIAAHNLKAVVYLYDLTEAQVSAVVRDHVPDEILVRQIVSRVYAGLWDEIATYDDSRYTLLGWLVHRAETFVHDRAPLPPSADTRA